MYKKITILFLVILLLSCSIKHAYKYDYNGNKKIVTGKHNLSPFNTVYLFNNSGELYRSNTTSIIESEESYIEIITDENILHLFKVHQKGNSIYINSFGLEYEIEPSFLEIKIYTNNIIKIDLEYSEIFYFKGFEKLRNLEIESRSYYSEFILPEIFEIEENLTLNFNNNWNRGTPEVYFAGVKYLKINELNLIFNENNIIGSLKFNDLVRLESNNPLDLTLSNSSLKNLEIVAPQITLESTNSSYSELNIVSTGEVVTKFDKTDIEILKAHNLKIDNSKFQYNNFKINNISCNNLEVLTDTLHSSVDPSEIKNIESLGSVNMEKGKFNIELIKSPVINIKNPESYVITSIESDNLYIDIAENSTMEIVNPVDLILLDIRSNKYFKIEGRTTNLKLDLNRYYGTFNYSDLISENVEVYLTGMSFATINARNSILYNLSENSTLNYYGTELIDPSSVMNHESIVNYLGEIQ